MTLHSAPAAASPLPALGAEPAPGAWTEERVAALARLWAEGHSASRIALQLTGVTRNAVIGKVHRLGLPGRARVVPLAAGRGEAPRDAIPREAIPREAIPREAAQAVAVPVAREDAVARQEAGGIVRAAGGGGRAVAMAGGSDPGATGPAGRGAASPEAGQGEAAGPREIVVGAAPEGAAPPRPAAPAAPAGGASAGPPGGEAASVVVPLTRRVTIMDLRETSCRWPLGDPSRPDFSFCGAQCPVGTPYCDAHSLVAFQPAAERRRR